MKLPDFVKGAFQSCEFIEHIKQIKQDKFKIMKGDLIIPYTLDQITFLLSKSLKVIKNYVFSFFV